jgi:hypothetical protein
VARHGDGRALRLHSITTEVAGEFGRRKRGLPCREASFSKPLF